MNENVALMTKNRIGIEFGGYTANVALAVLRVSLGLIAIGCIRFTHTPYCWPTFLVALIPLVLLWRGPLAPRTSIQVLYEAMLIGFVMEWAISHFIAAGTISQRERLMQLVGYWAYSWNIVAAGILLYYTRRRSLMQAVLVVAMAISLVETVLGHLLGITWVLNNPPLALAATPVAQWSCILPPIGFSVILYSISLLWLPDFTISGVRAWTSTCLAFCLTGFLWLGGMALEAMVIVTPFPFVAAAVQPHPITGSVVWRKLHELTNDSLNKSGSVDLIVWPEGSLDSTDCRLLPKEDDRVNLTSRWQGEALPLDRFRSELLPIYQTNCLVGADVFQLDCDDLPNSDGANVLRNYNCGCIVESTGKVSCHQKHLLVPLREGIPEWLNVSQIRKWLHNEFDWSAAYEAGSEVRSLSFRDQQGVTRKIAVSICYESWFPWLPQYHLNEPLDAICHLAYDGRFDNHPEYVQRMLLAVRLRAIETRTWQIVCTYFRGTAVIDPRGRIVAQLGFSSGVLRTDQLGEDAI